MMKQQLRIVLLLAALAAVAYASCPNACSGHGTCNGSDECTCYKEGKALYLGAGIDPTTGGDPRDMTESLADFRTADIIVVCDDLTASLPTDATTAICSSGMSNSDNAVAVSTGCANTATCYFDIRDGGSGYMAGTSATCDVADAADGSATGQYQKGCPAISFTTVGGSTPSSGDCSVTVTDGAITHAACLGSAATTSVTSITVHVSRPSYEGILEGARTQKAQWTGADCSLMTCPRGMSFTEIDTSSKILNTFFYTHADDVECSDAGICDRSSGQCQCNPGFEGKACERSACPEGCSGHGICQSNVKFAEDGGARYRHAWDSGKEMGCKCDSGWRGLDCASRECPSSADPLDFEGNGEGRDCSGRGMCDYGSGLCECFEGYTGQDCATILALM